MKALSGATFLVTRAEKDSLAWAKEIERRGGRAVVLPCVDFVFLKTKSTRQEIEEALGLSRWLLLTSPRAVEALDRLGVLPLSPGVQVAAVGPATAAEAEKHIGRVDYQGPGRGAGALAEALSPRLNPGERVAVPSSNLARRDVERLLTPLGVEVIRVVVYRTLPHPGKEGPFDLQAAGVDFIILASPSAVRGLLNRVPEFPPGLRCLTIGPATTEAAREAGLDVAAEAESPNLDSILEGIP